MSYLKNSNDNDFDECDNDMADKYQQPVGKTLDTWFLNNDFAWEQNENKKEDKEQEVVGGWGVDGYSDSKSDDSKFETSNNHTYYAQYFELAHHNIIEDDGDGYWESTTIKKKKDNDFTPFQQPKQERGLRPWKHKKKAVYSNDDSDEEQVVTVKRRK